MAKKKHKCKKDGNIQIPNRAHRLLVYIELYCYYWSKKYVQCELCSKEFIIYSLLLLRLQLGCANLCKLILYIFILKFSINKHSLLKLRIKIS